jgi:hypothetical protein
VYDTAPGYTGEHPPASVTGRPGEQFEPRPQYESPTYRDTNGFQPFQRPAPQDDAYSVIQRQAERIATLEACLARIEPRSSSVENHRGQPVDGPNSLLGRLDSHLRTDIEENRRPPDTVAIGGEDAFVFRGKGFKTQFYGPSSPMSAILNSHLILKFVGDFSLFSGYLPLDLYVCILNVIEFQRLSILLLFIIELPLISATIVSHANRYSTRSSRSS